MPEVTGFEYLIPWWLDVGPSDGDRSISYTELKSFDDTMSIFERETVRMMSKKYLFGLHNGRQKDAQPPYEWRTSDRAKKALNDKINRMFS